MSTESFLDDFKPTKVDNLTIIEGAKCTVSYIPTGRIYTTILPSGHISQVFVPNEQEKLNDD